MTNKGFIKIGLLLTISVILLVALGVVRAGATFTPKVNICHCPDGNPSNCQTLNIAIPAAIAHLQNHEQDYSGSCHEVEITPTVTPTITPTPTEEPKCDEDECEPTPTPTEEPTPTATPSATPTPQVETRVEAVGSGPSGLGVCVDPSVGTVANWEVVTGTPDDGKLTLNWALILGADEVVIYYGVNAQQPEHSVIVSNNGSFEIGGLTNGQHYFFAIAGKKGCAQGPLSSWIDPLP